MNFSVIMDAITKGVGTVNDVMSYILVVVLVIGGLYFTLSTKCVQFRRFKQQVKSIMERPADGKGVSSFQALIVSTASRVGTGNIIGVSTAICLGGYGAVFWMWIMAIVGGASAFAESTLAQIYKKKGKDGCYGGPAYYIESTLKSRPLAIIFTIFLMLTYGFGFNMLASYNLQATFSTYSFYNAEYTPWIIGLILAVLVGYCMLGGGKRIIKVTEFLVPIMGVIYILVAIVVVVINFKVIPGVMNKIFADAFDFKSIFGGISGSCMMYGIKRGLFSNEAGVGSAPNASAAAEVSHPVKQGLVQVLSVFIDTLLVCTATAFLCLCSGVEPTAEISGAPYVQQSMSITLGNIGPVFLTVAMILFAFTTLLGNLYYVDKSYNYLLGREPGKKFMNTAHVISAVIVFIGSGLNADLLWGIADITMAGMTLINIPVILILGKYVRRALNDYDMQLRAGKNPTFTSKSIGMDKELDYWN